MGIPIKKSLCVGAIALAGGAAAVFLSGNSRSRPNEDATRAVPILSSFKNDPPISQNAVFVHDLRMWDWASAESEWKELSVPPVVRGTTAKVFRHRSPFPGDVEFCVEPKIANYDSFVVGLSLNDSNASNLDGYVFRMKAELAATKDGSPNSRVELLRNGEMVAQQVLFEEPRAFSLRRCGSYVVGSVNGRAILSFRDERPLPGKRISFHSVNAEIPFDSIHTWGDSFRTDNFSSAPTDWRTAGAAVAEVTNRDQSDPRYTYFSLSNDRKLGNNAVLWNKRSYPSDVCIEFYFANRMAGERGQPYTYARDMNVTICSDGADLTKGYTFMFGGYGNQASLILRNGVEVARMRKTIPTDMNFHYHWFAYRVEKSAGHVSFRVDRMFENGSKTSEMVYDDPEPLGGDRIAIWTYDGTFMLGSVRISGEGGKIVERPGEAGPTKFLIEEPQK